MQLQDVYKLLHQAALGSEHAISNPDDARKRVERDLAEMRSGNDEVTMDPISPDGQIIRVHLHPYIAHGGDPETLLSAFIRTANEFHGDKNELESYWKTAKEMMHFSLEEMDEFMRPMRTGNYPAVHHSVVFASTYHPAYRVVLRELLDD
jgi:hypothetical protein